MRTTTLWLKAFQSELRYKSYNHKKFQTHLFPQEAWLLLAKTWFRLLPKGTWLLPLEHCFERAIPLRSNMAVFMNGKGWAAMLFFFQAKLLYFYNQEIENFFAILVLPVQIRPIFLFKIISPKKRYLWKRKTPISSFIHSYFDMFHFFENRHCLHQNQILDCLRTMVMNLGICPDKRWVGRLVQFQIPPNKGHVCRII